MLVDRASDPSFPSQTPHPTPTRRTEQKENRKSTMVSFSKPMSRERLPRGLNGPYITSPLAASRLGSRVWSSRSEYLDAVLADYDPHGRHHPSAVASRAVEKKARQQLKDERAWRALDDAARQRRRLWEGPEEGDDSATKSTKPGFLTSIRRPRVHFQLPDSWTGVKRCIRSSQETAEVGHSFCSAPT